MSWDRTMREYRNDPGTVTPAPHYVVEVNIRSVIPAVKPGTGNGGGTGDRQIDDVTRIVTKAANLPAAIQKVTRLLEVELENAEEKENI